MRLFEIKLFMMDDGWIRAELYDGDAFGYGPTVAEAVEQLQIQEVGKR